MTFSRFLGYRVLAAGLMVLALVSCNDKQNKNKNDMDTNAEMNNKSMAVDQQDSTFLVKADGINLEEIRLGQLAKDKSSTDEVKQLADMLVSDHQQLKQDLSNVAQKNNMNLPASLSDDAQDAYNTLNDLSGAEFDKKYADMMVQGHQKAIDLFEKDSSDTKDPAIKDYATKGLPLLRKHLQQAQSTKDKVDNSK